MLGLLNTDLTPVFPGSLKLRNRQEEATDGGLVYSRLTCIPDSRLCSHARISLVAQCRPSGYKPDGDHSLILGNLKICRKKLRTGALVCMGDASGDGISDGPLSHVPEHLVGRATSFLRQT